LTMTCQHGAKTLEELPGHAGIGWIAARRSISGFYLEKMTDPMPRLELHQLWQTSIASGERTVSGNWRSAAMS